MSARKGERRLAGVVTGEEGDAEASEEGGDSYAQHTGSMY